MLPLGQFIVFAGEPPTPEEMKGIVAAVQQSQKAGFEKHDLKTYMATWADTATFVGGRSDKPNKYDISLNRDQIEATRKVLFRGPSTDKVQMRFSEERSEYKDDTVIIRWTVELTFPRAKQRTGERYEMIRSDDGWKISTNRSWIIEYQPTDSPGLPLMKFDKAKWDLADRTVEQTIADPTATAIDRLYAYWDAARHLDVYNIACQELERDADNSDLWYWRGISAFQLGKVEDTRKSFERARALNPELQIPYFRPEDLKTPVKSSDN